MSSSFSTRLDVYLHVVPVPADPRLDQIVGLLQTISTQGNITMATLADIQNAVSQERTVEDSAVALLTQITQQLKDAQAANDPAAIQAVIDQIDQNRSTLAAAVAANTPTANPPSPAPTA